VEETGGAKTHTLTTPEIPAHTHSLGYVDALNAGGSVGTRAFPGAANTGSAGGGGAHNNLQPYIVVYMWKRTA
jgi:microcystin-dependent protein